MRLTDEHKQIQDTVTQFVAREMDPYADEWEAEGKFPAHALFKKMGDLGLLGIAKPEAYGGLGLDYTYQIIFSEAIGATKAAGASMAIGVQTDMATPALAKFGSDELREQFLAPAIAGDMVCSIAVSEPHAGSDVAAIRTTARTDGDDYVINGSKMWITTSTQADFLCLLANTSDGPAHTNKSLIVVPTDSKGFSTSKPLDKLGMRDSDTAQVFLEDVRVPRRFTIGDPGAGFTYQMMQFQEERLFAAAGNLRAMERCIELTAEYARERKTFGKSILDNQVVQFRLAELQTEIESLRALTYSAVEDYVAGDDVTTKASMCKLKGGRLLREVTDSCLQYWGGMGYMWDNPVARAYRDGRLSSIGGGADEIMLGIIVKRMGLGGGR
ncbi:MAG: acyl-CoA dehydrogenase family protein [Pseudomonadota bacterium]